MRLTDLSTANERLRAAIARLAVLIEESDAGRFSITVSGKNSLRTLKRTSDFIQRLRD